MFVAMDAEGWTTIIQLVVFVALPLSLFLWLSGRKQKKLNEARKLLRDHHAKLDLEYKDALSLLSVEPTRANRIAALEAGRRLVEFARESGQTTLFDEVRLQNDLQAYGAD